MAVALAQQLHARSGGMVCSAARGGKGPASTSAAARQLVQVPRAFCILQKAPCK